MKKSQKDQELLNACYFGNKTRAISLLRDGANPNYMDTRDGWSGLHYSSRWGQIKVVKELLTAGANVNLLTKDNESPLHIACSKNRKEVCIWLMKNGANPKLLDHSQQRPTDMTADKEIKFICEHFEEYIKIITEQQKIKVMKRESKK